MPCVTVWPTPKGSPMASTTSPTCSASELPSSRNGSFAQPSLMRSTARSLRMSLSTILASNSRLSLSATLSSAAEVGSRRSCAMAGAASAGTRVRAAISGLSGKTVMAGPGGSIRSTYRAGIGRKMAALTLVTALAAPAMAQDRRVPASDAELKLSYAPLVKNVAPAVVNVYAAKVVQNRNPLFDDPIFRQFFGGRGLPGGAPQVQRSLGTGVIVAPSRHIDTFL